MTNYHTVQIKVSISYHQAFLSILSHTGSNQATTGKAILECKIRELAQLILGVDLGDQHGQLYQYWSASKALKANSFDYHTDKPLITKAISLFGWDNIIQAIDTYAEIVHHPESYMMYPISRLEEWILNDITNFLPGAALDPYVKYARPAEVSDPVILALKVSHKEQPPGDK